MSWVQNQLDDEKLFPQKIGESQRYVYINASQAHYVSTSNEIPRQHVRC